MNILHISASPRGANSLSRKLGGMCVDRLKLETDSELCRRDLTLDSPAFPDACFAEASLLPPAARTSAHELCLQDSELLIRELAAATTIVIDMPMHNFTVPAVFKAWIDRVVRPGRTFAHSTPGKKGLLADRPTTVIVASGGSLDTALGGQPDFLTPYVTQIFKTIGIVDVTFIYLQNSLRSGVASSEPRAVELLNHRVDSIVASLSY